MSFFFSTEDQTVDIDRSAVLKEGHLSKKSKYLGVWRSRWTVVTKTHIFTFENMKQYRHPTEVLNLAANGRHATAIPGHEYGGQFCIQVLLKEGDSYIF